MTTEELVNLVNQYPEWNDDEDETGMWTGWVYCRICDGGGWMGLPWHKKDEHHQSGNPPQHKPNCPRLRFEQEYKVEN